MDMISGLLAQSQPKPQSAYGTITRLCDRLQNSNLLEDRQAAVLGLKGFSREYRETVATSGLKALVQALQRDNEDVETCRATLETLVILFIKNEEASTDLERQSRLVREKNKKYPSPLLKEKDGANEPQDFIALWLSDEFSQKEENMSALLEIVQHTTDFYSKLYALQLLAAILVNRPQRAQECIFASATGVSTLVSCLDMNVNEVVRNEAVLVLLSLVDGNIDIQKVVAFDGAFEKVFKIINIEGGLEGGLIVEDCLTLVAALLKYNTSNQRHFREASCIPALNELLIVPIDESNGMLDAGWNDQSWTNLTIVLEIIQLFVPDGQEATAVNQAELSKAVLTNVLRLAFGPQTQLAIRSVALVTASDIIRSNSDSQQQFLMIDVPYIDLSSAILREPDVVPVTQALLNWALLCNTSQTFELRVSASKCLDAVFRDNEHEKEAFIYAQIKHFKDDYPEEPSKENGDDNEEQHVQRPPPGSANLIAALVDYDPDIRLNPYKVWFAAMILLQLFEDSHEVRDILRGVTIGDESIGEEKVSVIQSISGMLVTSLQYQDPRISIAYLMVLSVWNYDDINAVKDFLDESATIQALISMLSYSGGVNPMVESMTAVLLGITYDFCSRDSPVSRYVSDNFESIHN